jgi:hypothetical protein
VWVANEEGHSVTKLRASDGAVLGTFVAGLGPHSVAFDGANVWVTTGGPDDSTSPPFGIDIYKL